MDLMKTVLMEIKAGKHSFGPDDESARAIAAFQPVAQRLQSAKQRGLIGNLRVRTSKMRDSHGNVIGAIVNGGLTFEGDSFLKFCSARQNSRPENPCFGSNRRFGA